MKVLGMMTGTSMDGLDCCYVNIKMDKNLKLNFQLIDFKMYKFPKQIVDLIIDSIGDNNKEVVAEAHEQLGRFFLDSCIQFINNKKIDLISMHGQTISHLNGVRTKQIGNPKYLHNFFNVPIVYDFRNKDIQLGGNGAPLVPFLDWLLYKNIKENIVTLNIGGIANLTFIPADGNRDDVLGFDTGPGMCLIDSYANMIWGTRIDNNSKFSLKGKISSELLDYLMREPYINAMPPKSTTTEYFDKIFLLNTMKKFKKITKCDFIRTLVNFTAKSIILNINNFIDNGIKYRIIISGGGANHPLLVKDLKDNAKSIKFERFNNNKLCIDSKESFLIALLGYTRYNNIPNNMQMVTGAKSECVYGEIYE